MTGNTRKTKVSRDTHPTDARPTKTSRQLFLWEPPTRTTDEHIEKADLYHDGDEDASTTDSTRNDERQLQWTHRWLEESTLE